MTTMAPDIARSAGAAHCGCCGRALPANRMTELGSTPGVFICASCAVWAARHASRFPVVRLDPRLAARWLRRRIARTAGSASVAIPILYSADLDRTAEHYRSLGLRVVEQEQTYLVMQLGGAELHFTTSGEVASAPGQAFMHVYDAGELWKQLQERGVAGIGPVEDRPTGLREFTVTDPDGNRIRVGSPIPAD
jgi:catechol 2,3-dioxygenase-like lactoylglutathione lyase family enzyme